MARDYIPKTWDGLASAVARDVYKKLGNKIAKEMAHQYSTAISSFYDDYHPRVYRRTYRSRYFAGEDYVGIGGVKNYTRFVKMDPDGKGFSVRMVVSPGNLTTPYTSIKNGKGTASLTGMVFINTWVFGQHGGMLPYEIIPEDLRVKNIDPTMWKPFKSTGWTWIPPIMEESPMQQMDRWFARYATNSNLDNLTRNIVTTSINTYITKAKNKHGSIN